MIGNTLITAPMVGGGYSLLIQARAKLADCQAHLNEINVALALELKKPIPQRDELVMYFLEFQRQKIASSVALLAELTSAVNEDSRSETQAP